MTRPVPLFGASSILGFNLATRFPSMFAPFISPGNRSTAVRTWPDLQLQNLEWVTDIFAASCPDLLVYCHAVCDVPKCEADPAWAQEMNIHQLRRVVEALPAAARLVYISSDHVFGGDGAYHEKAPPCPMSVYGRTRVEAEKLVLRRKDSLVIRTGLAIGPSPDGRTGHLDWLRYRMERRLPITIVEDEARSTVWVSDLCDRVVQLAHSTVTGIRHIPATRAVSRVELAKYLLRRLQKPLVFKRESRHQRPTPHLGKVELTSLYTDRFAQPLASVPDGESPSAPAISDIDVCSDRNIEATTLPAVSLTR